MRCTVYSTYLLYYVYDSESPSKLLPVAVVGRATGPAMPVMSARRAIRERTKLPSRIGRVMGDLYRSTAVRLHDWGTMVLTIVLQLKEIAPRPRE